MGYGTGLVAGYGINKFIVRFPAVTAVDYPKFKEHTTLHGRLISFDTIVNVEMSLDFDEEVCVMCYL